MKKTKTGTIIENGQSVDLVKLTKQLEDYSITLDIKNNVIDELENKLNNSSSANTAILRGVPLLHKVILQLFWASHNSGFSEEASSVKEAILTNGPVETIFQLPAKVLEDTQFFRLDIGNSIGFSTINSLEIKDSKGKSIWQWDKKAIIHKNGLVFIQNNISWPNSLVHLSLSDDPHFIIACPALKNSKENNYSVSLVLSPLTDVQSQTIFNLVSAPLTYSAYETIEFNKALDIFKEEKQTFINEISNTRNEVKQLTEEKISLIKDAENIKTTLQSLTAEKDNLAGQVNFYIGKVAEQDTLFRTELAQRDALFNQKITEQERVFSESNARNSNLLETALADNKQLSEFIIQLKNDEALRKAEIEKYEHVLAEREVAYKNETLTLRSHIEQLKEKHSLAVKHFEMLDGLNKKIDNEKALLLKEIDNKTLIIGKLFHHKEQIEKALEDRTVQIENILETKRLLEKDLVNEQKKLLETDNQLQQTIINLNNKQEEVKALYIDKETQQKNISDLNSHISTITVQNNNLISQSEQQQNTIKSINEKASLLNKELTKTKTELEHALLEIKSLLADNAFLTENYLNKSALQIMVNRIAGKNRFPTQTHK